MKLYFLWSLHQSYVVVFVSIPLPGSAVYFEPGEGVCARMFSYSYMHAHGMSPNIEGAACQLEGCDLAT